MAAAGYDLSVATYSPEGRLHQIEYAQKAVQSGGTIVGVKCKNGVVLAVEKLLNSKMLVPGSNKHVFSVDEQCGMIVAGVLPDAKRIVRHTMEECKMHRKNFGGAITPDLLSDRIGSLMHTFTQHWSARPFGSGIIMAGYDQTSNDAFLYCVDPSGVALRHFGAAMGKGARVAKTELEKGGFENVEVEEAFVKLAKIIEMTHDEVKDKPYELELSHISDVSGWRHEICSLDKWLYC
eukprot:TRINITY_DN648_c0_g1_i2.p1 TRINITY_DN648_c0_g1~~TRINITY_DN648_c0_g1_i2.p1  ORF type:complete len:236 (-),score=30.16 TRINITY_DN648_c0_g1_i2:431-1138(-)